MSRLPVLTDGTPHYYCGMFMFNDPSYSGFRFRMPSSYYSNNDNEFAWKHLQMAFFPCRPITGYKGCFISSKLNVLSAFLSISSSSSC